MSSANGRIRLRPRPRPHVGAPALRDRRLGRRRQVHADRPPALRLQGDLRGPARAGRGHEAARPASTATATARPSTSRCSRTGCAPSASRASRSTSPTATSRRRGASSSSPTPPATSSTRATWSRARRPPTCRSCSSTPATASSSSRAATPTSRRCCASPTSCSRSTRWTSSAGTRTSSTRSSRSSRTSPRCWTSPTSRRSRSRRSRATTSSSARRTCPGTRGRRCSWHLERVHIASDRNLADTRFPVQWVIRPGGSSDYRAYAGQVAGGVLRPGDEVVVLPSGRTSRIDAIDLGGEELEQAYPPMSVALRLTDDVDVSRGDMICAAEDSPAVSRDLEAIVCWMADAPLRERGRYVLKHTTRSTRALVDQVAYRVDVNDPPPRRVRRRARPQRHRPRAHPHRRAGRRRPLHPQPLDRLVHPHRRVDQRHRRRRPDHGREALTATKSTAKGPTRLAIRWTSRKPASASRPANSRRPSSRM